MAGLLEARASDPPLTAIQSGSVIHPQAEAAVEGVADRLRPRGAVEEEVGDPALGDAEAEPAAIFEPVLVSDCRHHIAVAGHGRDDAGMRPKGLHEAAIDVGLDVAAEQMRPLSADLDQIGLVGAGGNRGIEWIEGSGRIAIAGHPLPELPDFDRGCDLVAGRYPTDPASPAVDAVIRA